MGIQELCRSKVGIQPLPSVQWPYQFAELVEYCTSALPSSPPIAEVAGSIPGYPDGTSCVG